MKLAKAILCVLIVSLLVSMTIPMASAPRPENPGGGGGGKDKPAADPVIAVVSPTGRGYNGLHVMNADGSNKVEVHDGSNLDRPSWSPDGGSIAFTASYFELWRIDVELDEDGVPVGINPTQLLPDIHSGPEWSPGGLYSGYILFTRGSQRDLEVIHATDGDTQILHTVAVGHHIWNPVWSPGGDRIAFMEWDGDHYALKIWNVVLEVETTVLNPFIGNNLDWARQRTEDEIAYLGGGYKVRNKWIYELYTVDINSGVTKFLFEGKKPTWSPDDKLCFEHKGLMVHDFGTGESQQISKWGYNPDWCRRPPVLP